VCDDEWHQYLVNYAANTAALIVDAVPMVVANNNPEILYDKPMHMVKDMKVSASRA